MRSAKLDLRKPLAALAVDPVPVSAPRRAFSAEDSYEGAGTKVATKIKRSVSPIHLSEPSAKKPKLKLPEEPAAIGDLVGGPKIDLTATDVLKAYVELQRKAKKDPDLLAKLRKQNFPASKSAQLDWALAYSPKQDRLSDPLWSVATNDAAPALVAYVHGVIAARRAGIEVDDKLEKRIVKAQLDLYQRIAENPKIYETLESAPYPVTEHERLVWAIGVLLTSWDPDKNPALAEDPKAQALVSLVAGVLAKKNNNDSEVLVRAERRTMEIDGDTRVYAVFTPDGERPAKGWPTMMFFHGSYGGYAPEQSPDYQALSVAAQLYGFQVLYPVGSPQDRADLLKTGRGMLNWDPVGAGPGGVNDRFVHELLNKLIQKGEVDKTKVFVAGHSQGGFYVSNLIGSYPKAFAAAAIFGAGAGSVASTTSFADLPRKTPLFMNVGTEDVHVPMADDFAERLKIDGYGKDLSFNRLDGRGHEVVFEDYVNMFQWFAEHDQYESSQLGTLDGKGEGAAEQIYRPFVDLDKPPEKLKKDALALETMRTIAEHPFFDLDGNTTRLSADEWRLAAYRLEGWPVSMQKTIADLRKYFVVAPPPKDVVWNMDKLPPEVSSDPIAMSALLHISKTPALDRDGYPALVSAREIAAAESFAEQLPPLVRQGLIKLKTITVPKALIG
jgi:poly(3-hydroxybutyrate) depolymerase